METWWQRRGTRKELDGDERKLSRWMSKARVRTARLKERIAM